MGCVGETNASFEVKYEYQGDGRWMIKRTGCATDFFHDYAVCLVAHGEPTVIFICRDTQEPFSRSNTAFLRLMGALYPASPNFLHISFGNSLCLSVFAASSSGISRSATHA